MKIGQRVKILDGMSEFIGQTGTVSYPEKDGRVTLYRVRVDEPVDVTGVGMVCDALWEGRFLKAIR